MKTKSDFIADLLSNKRMSIPDRERILKLTAQTLNLESSEIAEIWKEILNLKNSISHPTKNSKILKNPLSPEEQELFENTGFTFEDLDDELLPTGLKNDQGDYKGFENNSIAKEHEQKEASKKLRVSINPVDSEKGKIKLKRKIIIEKGENLPLEEFFDNNEQLSVTKNHRPKETKLFLSLFNNSEGLKYLTHKFNDGKRNYDAFIELCKSEFDNGKSDYPNVPDAVLRRIEEFAFAPNPEWFIRNGNEKIFPKIGWAEASFIEWYKKDINIHPGFDSKWNTEMIVPFKESIEVRAGNLKTIIEEILTIGLGISKSNFIITPNEQNINTAEFYTDVDKLKLALGHIFSTIKERADKNFCFEIEIDFKNESLDGGNFKKLLITHLNSEPTKHSNDKDFVKGDIKTIQSNLWGLCNYEIAAKFPDGFRKKIILTDDYNDYKNYVVKGDSIPINDSMKVKGFTHILKFY